MGWVFVTGGFRMKTMVTTRGLRAAAGWGVPWRKVALDDIESFRAVRWTRASKRRGRKLIRLLGAGPGAVEVTPRRSGKKLVVGTDDPDGLVDALERFTGIQALPADR